MLSAEELDALYNQSQIASAAPMGMDMPQAQPTSLLGNNQPYQGIPEVPNLNDDINAYTAPPQLSVGDSVDSSAMPSAEGFDWGKVADHGITKGMMYALQSSLLGGMGKKQTQIVSPPSGGHGGTPYKPIWLMGGQSPEFQSKLAMMLRGR